VTREGLATLRGDVTAIVLAGGRSARFGGPKLEATVDGVTVLDRALLAVDQVAAAIILAGPEPMDLPALAAPLRTIVDDTPFAGPLVALSGALRLAGTDLALVVGGDMPALVPDVLRLLLDRLRTDATIDAVILETPVVEAKTPVLPLALRVAPGSEAAAAAAGRGDRSILRLLARLRSASIPAAQWLALDPGADTLLDVDVPADLDRLRGNEIR
jgi:molybdopterin-guanine dinucleotide biosynthesis protein A